MYFNDETEVMQFWQECYRSDTCPYQCVILRGHDANLSYCRRWYLKDVEVSAKFLCRKLIMSPFVINKYLGLTEILGD